MAARLRSRWLPAFLAVACGYVAVLSAGIVRQAARDETRPADAIVVFGAAEYDGRPSPVFKARLDHAAQLYHRGLAPIVIATGGAGADLKYSEGEVGREYLKTQGVPDEHLIAETQGSDTAASARRVANIMRVNRMTTCLAVSDAYHIFRIKKMLGREGITSFGSPRPNSRPLGLWKKSEAVFHEVSSFTVWLMGLS